MKDGGMTAQMSWSSKAAIPYFTRVF